MTSTTLLDGKWEFINHEIYLSQTDTWIPQADFVNGMTWQFRLGCAFRDYEQGIIVESAPEVEDVEMEYIYSPKHGRLTVDVEIQDVYYLTFDELGSPASTLQSDSQPPTE
ncbi:MAG: hypothetical protein SNH35_03145 [Rikenellaceae bacterium]